MVTSLTATYRDTSNVQRYVNFEYDPGRDSSAPVVLLLHGNGGNRFHMISPTVSPGFAYDLNYQPPSLIDRGWRSYPGVGPWSFEVDPPRPNVTSWRDTVLRNGFGTAWYDQRDNTGLLANPVRELDGVVRKLAENIGNRPIVLLVHSRGGLLARRFLANIRSETALRNRIKLLLTMHSPHQGSELANKTRDFGTAVDAFTWTLGGVFPAVTAVLQLIKSMVMNDSYKEMAIGSQFLRDLSAEEAAAGGPIVPTYTWGGTKSLLIRPRQWEFTWGSKIPQVISWWPYRMGFHWYTERIDYPKVAGEVNQIINLAQELRNGVGDVLTVDTRTRLPGERGHTTNYLNHAEALWDENLAAQAVGIIRSQGGRASALTGTKSAATAETAPA